MLELALCAVAAVLALGGAGLASRFGGADGVTPPTVRAARLVRDDALVGAAASVFAFAAAAIGVGIRSPLHAALAAAAWSAGSCAAGALAAIGARAFRERLAPSSAAAGAVGEQVVVTAALVAVTVIAAAASHTLSAPERLAPKVPELVVAFALGCAVQGLGARALPSVAAMVLASYFFDANGAVLRSAPSYASALGLVLFPLAATALGAVGAAATVLAHGRAARHGAVSSRPASHALSAALGGVLAVPAFALAALALLGWVWQPLALAAALGATMTLVPALVRRDGRAREGWALGALGVAAIGSFAVARHAGLAHAGPLGVGIAAVAAESAALLPRESGDESGALVDRQAAALAAIAVALAVLDAGALARCAHFTALAHAPAGDGSVALAHCTLAAVVPAHVNLAHPVTIVAALGAIAACALVQEGVSLAGRLVTSGGVLVFVAVAAVAAHFAFALGVESLAAAALASSLAAAFLPSACSRPVAALVAATGLTLVAAAG